MVNGEAPTLRNTSKYLCGQCHLEVRRCAFCMEESTTGEECDCNGRLDFQDDIGTFTCSMLAGRRSQDLSVSEQQNLIGNILGMYNVRSQDPGDPTVENPAATFKHEHQCSGVVINPVLDELFQKVADYNQIQPSLLVVSPDVLHAYGKFFPHGDGVVREPVGIPADRGVGTFRMKMNDPDVSPEEIVRFKKEWDRVIESRLPSWRNIEDNMAAKGYPRGYSIERREMTFEAASFEVGDCRIAARSSGIELAAVLAPRSERYPHECKVCGGACYRGFMQVECTTTNCAGA